MKKLELITELTPGQRVALFQDGTQVDTGKIIHICNAEVVEVDTERLATIGLHQVDGGWKEVIFGLGDEIGDPRNDTPVLTLQSLE